MSGSWTLTGVPTATAGAAGEAVASGEGVLEATVAPRQARAAVIADNVAHLAAQPRADAEHRHARQVHRRCGLRECEATDPPGSRPCIDPLSNLNRSRAFTSRSECHTYRGPAVRNTKRLYERFGFEVKRHDCCEEAITCCFVTFVMGRPYGLCHASWGGDDMVKTLET